MTQISELTSFRPFPFPVPDNGLPYPQLRIIEHRRNSLSRWQEDRRRLVWGHIRRCVNHLFWHPAPFSRLAFRYQPAQLADGRHQVCTSPHFTILVAFYRLTPNRPRNREKLKPRSFVTSAVLTAFLLGVVSNILLGSISVRLTGRRHRVRSWHPSNIPLRTGGTAQHSRNRSAGTQLGGPVRYVRTQVLDQDRLYGSTTDGAHSIAPSSLVLASNGMLR